MSNNNQNICTCGCCEGAEHVTPVNVENKPGLSALHYRVGTHSSFKESMLRSVSGNKALSALSSRSGDDMAIATLDAWATVLDVLSFYQERMINEGYLRTATERFSIVELARLISYRPGPGVAAGTFLKFSMNESPGAPAVATIPIGTKVQSIPEQDQLPQLFETMEQIEARVEWNAMKLRTKKRSIPEFGHTEIYLQGINTGLQPGDGLLMIGDERAAKADNENWDFRKVKTITANTVAGHTKVTWSDGLGVNRHGKKVLPAAKGFKIYALRQRASLFGYNAPEWRLLSKEVRERFLNGTGQTSDANTEVEWKGFDIETISGEADTIHLDTIYAKIIKGSWIVMATPEYEEVYKVEAAAESARKDFALASKTMALKIKGENLKAKFNKHVRDTIVYGQNEELEIAETPVTDSIGINSDKIILEKMITGLAVAKPVIISGKRMRLLLLEAAGKPIFTVTENSSANRELAPGNSLILKYAEKLNANGHTRWFVKDDAGLEGNVEINESAVSIIASVKGDEMVSELHTIKLVEQNTDPTVLILAEPVVNYYDPFTVVVYANVVAATHGETRQEVLGSGDGSKRFQKFELKQAPLTFVSAATASGTKTTLQVRVNDILWQEADTLYGALPGDKIYVTNINDNAKVTVAFGDGITGARLPTGTENVKATYRVGIGTPGLLHAGQLSMLMTPQLGVNGVTNPLDTAGAANPESRDDARQNAPLTVLTLDRIVSVADYENFTRAFAGIGKARAEMIWSGEKQVVFITVAANDQSQLDKNSPVYINLSQAVKAASHSNNTIYIENYTSGLFSLKAAIKVDSRYLFENVKNKVEEVLKTAFSFAARDFGQNVSQSEVIAVIQKVEGVVYVRLEELRTKTMVDKLPGHIPSKLAALQFNGKINPAELLAINSGEIHITEIIS